MTRGWAPSKKDATQPAIEQAFARAGWSIDDTHITPHGFDLYVAKRGVTIAIECKTGRRKRTPEQVEKAEQWQGLYLTGSDPLVMLETAEAMLEDHSHG